MADLKSVDELAEWIFAEYIRKPPVQAASFGEMRERLRVLAGVQTGPKVMKDPANWTGEPDLVARQLLLKLAEEAGELCSAACRCAMQGLDECEPVTGKPNRQWLQEERADVRALSQLLGDYIHQPEDNERADMKYDHKTKWVKLLKDSLNAKIDG